MRLSLWDGHCAKCFVNSRIHLLLKIIQSPTLSLFYKQGWRLVGSRPPAQADIITKWWNVDSYPGEVLTMAWLGPAAWASVSQALPVDIQCQESVPVPFPHPDSGGTCGSPLRLTHGGPERFCHESGLSNHIRGGEPNDERSTANCRHTRQWPQCFQIKFLKRP